jgi:hypothetical protein
VEPGVGVGEVDLGDEGCIEVEQSVLAGVPQRCVVFVGVEDDGLRGIELDGVL